MCLNASHGLLGSCPNQWTMEGQMFLVLFTAIILVCIN